jgi:hypothetical protein
LKLATTNLVVTQGLIPIVKGTETEPHSSDTDALKNWRTHELDARVQIQLTLEEEQHQSYVCKRHKEDLGQDFMKVTR